MTTCRVRDCTDEATEHFEHSVPDGVMLQWAVCAFHGQALAAGEVRTISEDQSELLLGTQGALEIVNLTIQQDALGSTVTLMLGHDKIEAQRVSFQMLPEHARSLCYWVAGGPHTDDGVEAPGSTGASA